MATLDQKPKPEYSEALLIRIINDTKSIQDLADVGKLYQDLAEARDIHISQKIMCFCRVKHQELIYGNKLNNGKNKN